MGKQIPAVLLAHYQQDATTTCLLTRVKCKDGTLLAFTDLDVDVVYDPADYDPGGTGDDWGELTHTADNGGFSFARLESAADLTVDNTELSGVVVDTGITMQKIRAGLFDSAEVRIYRVNYMDLSQGHELVAAGQAGQTQFTRNTWTTEFRALTELLKEPDADLQTVTCGKQFGKATHYGNTGCPKDFTWVDFTVTAVGDDPQLEFTADITPDDGTYLIGVVQWVTGANAGAEMETSGNTAGAIDLALPMDYAIQIGDTGRIRKDCNKEWDDADHGCLFHWGADRADYFGGFPHIPIADGGASQVPGAQVGASSD